LATAIASPIADAHAGLKLRPGSFGANTQGAWKSKQGWPGTQGTPGSRCSCRTTP